MNDSAAYRQDADAAPPIHRTLGPGLLEAIYFYCLAWELEARGRDIGTQIAVPIRYRGRILPHGLRIDLSVDNAVIVEVKSCEALLPVHKAQLLTYLKLSERMLGLLINFNVTLLKTGISRVVHSSQ
jgi:GxxExxY protein